MDVVSELFHVAEWLGRLTTKEHILESEAKRAPSAVQPSKANVLIV